MLTLSERVEWPSPSARLRLTILQLCGITNSKLPVPRAYPVLQVPWAAEIRAIASILTEMIIAEVWLLAVLGASTATPGICRARSGSFYIIRLTPVVDSIVLCDLKIANFGRSQLNFPCCSTGTRWREPEILLVWARSRQFLPLTIIATCYT